MSPLSLQQIPEWTEAGLMRGKDKHELMRRLFRLYNEYIFFSGLETPGLDKL